MLPQAVWPTKPGGFAMEVMRVSRRSRANFFLAKPLWAFFGYDLGRGSFLSADTSDWAMSCDNSGIAPSISRGGRPTHALAVLQGAWYRRQFSGRYKASCNFCGKIFRDGRITDFENHITDTDRALDKEGRPVTFTEFLMGKDYDLAHPAL